MASLTQRSWVWANSGRWWRTGKPGVLQSMGLRTVRHNWATNTFTFTIAWPLSNHHSSPCSIPLFCLPQVSAQFDRHGYDLVTRKKIKTRAPPSTAGASGSSRWPLARDPDFVCLWGLAIITFGPHKASWLGSVSYLKKWRSWDSERIITCPTSHRSEIKTWTQVFWLKIPCCLK